MPTQTDLKRKASSRKGQATRKRSEASQAQSTEGTVKSRADAEREAAAARALTAARALDVTLGGAEAARNRIAGAFEQFSDPRDLLRRTTDDAKRTLDQFESRGAVTRRKIGRDARRRAKQVRERVSA